jgi:hypothetical protein
MTNSRYERVEVYDAWTIMCLSSSKNFDDIDDGSLANGAFLVGTEALPAADCVLAGHYYRILLHLLADHALLLAVLVGLPVVRVELALVDQVGTQLELAFVLQQEGLALLALA